MDEEYYTYQLTCIPQKSVSIDEQAFLWGLLNLCLFVCLGCTMAFTWKSEDNVQELVSSLYHVGDGNVVLYAVNVCCSHLVDK